MFFIDAMSSAEIEKLSPGSILLVDRDSSKFKHIPLCIKVRLGDTPPELLTLLPAHISHIFILNHTPLDTIKSIPKDKILEIDIQLTPSRIYSIRSHAICLAMDLSQETIDKLVSNYLIQKILLSPTLSKQNLDNLLAKLNLALENHRKLYPSRELIIDSPTDNDKPEVVYVSDAKIPQENTDLTRCDQSESFEKEEKPLLAASYEGEDSDRLMASALTFVVSQFNNYQMSSEQLIAELKLKILTLQQEVLELKQRQATPNNLYVGLTMDSRKKRMTGTSKEENTSLKKALNEEKREKILAEKHPEDANRASAILARVSADVSALRFLNNRAKDCSQSLPDTLERQVGKRV